MVFARNHEVEGLETAIRRHVPEVDHLHAVFLGELDEVLLGNIFRQFSEVPNHLVRVHCYSCIIHCLSPPLEHLVSATSRSWCSSQQVISSLVKVWNRPFYSRSSPFASLHYAFPA